MSFLPNFPPSMIARISDDADEIKKKTKEDYRKMKELEEARKLATVPAMKDEEGNDINPHIPQYIMQAPWYYGSLKPTLRHQRILEKAKTAGHEDYSNKMNEWYKRGVIEDRKASKFRKGACENCGALTHKRKDCFERPRQVGAKLTGDDIAPDEYEQPALQLTFEAKRDRWNGYDASKHRRVIDQHAKLEDARRAFKNRQLEEKLSTGDLTVTEDVSVVVDQELEDEDKYGDEMDMPGQKFDSKQRQSIRNLRIREDTAKYLHNLNVDSAYYDPKTRSMRENPFQSTGKDASEVPYAGDNFVRYQGDAHEMMEQQVFAWDMHGEKGLDVHLQADPTRLELLKREVRTKEKELLGGVKEEILSRYGGEEHFKSASRDLSLAQTDHYVEYSRTGHVIKGRERALTKSRYEEDVMNSNHTAVWGSFWKGGKWGYKCCHSFVKESYCLGTTGRTLAINESMPPPATAPSRTIASKRSFSHDAAQQPLAITASDAADVVVAAAVDLTQPTPPKKCRKEKKSSESSSSSSSSSTSSSSSSSSSSSGSDGEEEKETRLSKRKKTTHEKDSARSKKQRLADALTKEKERRRAAQLQVDERTKAYNCTYDNRMPTDEEMEAYRQTRTLPDDPMANFLKNK